MSECEHLQKLTDQKETQLGQEPIYIRFIHGLDNLDSGILWLW
jgi:hypothetical protein